MAKSVKKSVKKSIVKPINNHLVVDLPKKKLLGYFPAVTASQPVTKIKVKPKKSEVKLKPKLIEVELGCSDISTSSLEGSLDSAIAILSDLKKKHKGKNLSLSLVTRPFDNHESYVVYHKRRETKEEFKARVDKEASEKSRREAIEKEKLKELIAKFGIPNG